MISVGFLRNKYSRYPYLGSGDAHRLLEDSMNNHTAKRKHNIETIMEPHNMPPAFTWNDVQALKALTLCQTLPNVNTICVTGGAGFIGSWFLRNMTLAYTNYHFVCFDIFDVCSSPNNLRILEQTPNFSIFRGDIRNAEAVRQCFSQHSVDAIVHFAAQSHVDLSFDGANAFCETNVTGTVILLEAAREYGISRFIHVSTDEVYGEVLPGGSDYDETAPLHPTNPYSGSKAAAEMMVCAFSKSFGIPAIIVRSNNVYGPNQFPEKLIPKLITLVLRGEKVPLYGDGSYVRRYVYAGDIVDAFNIIFHEGEVGQTYNIGSYDEVSNIEIVKKIVRAVDIADNYQTPTVAEVDLAQWVRWTPNRPFMDRRYGVDFSKLRALGWSPKTSFEDGLRQTIDWYRQFGEEWWGDISVNLGAGKFKP
ncbi:hypothetical protein NUW58_g4395 [Xylaria curta]|uniref:Uncharacterized protein n=1 Tax=Xylaria curta TaxID=42375 RepID=A0ACC1P710_9PEZI|nr:hypothetical protein NUW58_g4395 [Xylaria curta]